MKKAVLPTLVVILLVVLIFVVLYLYKSNDKTENTNNVNNQTNTSNLIDEPDEPENTFILKVNSSSWSGLAEEYEPEIIETEYDTILDEEYTIGNGSLALTFTIEEINEDNIVIRTTEVFSDSEDGIDLNTKKKKFTVYLDEELKLETPTMDAGNTYYLTLLNKESKDDNNLENLEIEYKTGGGFGTKSDTALVTININSDKVVLSYQDISKELPLDEEKYTELVDLINEKFYDIDEDADSNEDILDGSLSYITVTNEDGESYEVGGYMPQDSDYKKIESKIYKIVDSKTISDFRNNELKEYFENN